MSKTKSGGHVSTLLTVTKDKKQNQQSEKY